MLSFRKPRRPPLLVRDEESLAEELVVTREAKPEDPRERRLRFISEKVAEIRKRQLDKQTFLTDPNFVVEEETTAHSKEVVVVPKEVVQEYRQMLSDVMQASREVRQNTDDLSELRYLVKQTRNNITHHISTVDQLRHQLTSISRRSLQTLETPSPKQKFTKPRRRNLQTGRSTPWLRQIPTP